MVGMPFTNIIQGILGSGTPTMAKKVWRYGYLNIRELFLYTLHIADDLVAHDKNDLKFMTRKLMEKCKKWSQREYGKNQILLEEQWKT